MDLQAIETAIKERNEEKRDAYARDARTFAEYASQLGCGTFAVPENIEEKFPFHIALRRANVAPNATGEVCVLSELNLTQGRQYSRFDYTLGELRAKILEHMKPYLEKGDAEFYKLDVNPVEEKSHAAAVPEKTAVGA